jgi:hypothetical protein
LIGIFLLGLAALGVDRTLLRPQGGAHAASADWSPPPAAAIEAANSAPVPPGEASAPRLAERLGRLAPEHPADLSQMRDAFALPGSWDAEPAADTKAPVSPIARFIRSHRLGAVVMEGPDSCVLVDDRFLRLGQQIDGFTLVTVGERSAVFERDGEQAHLELASQ